MAAGPMRPCRHAGCAELTRDGWCSKHKPTQTRIKSAGYHDWYSEPTWRFHLRAQQLLKEPFCRACAAKGISTRATVVDHIKPHEGNRKLFEDPENLQSLCKYHHDQKTMRENQGII